MISSTIVSCSIRKITILAEYFKGLIRAISKFEGIVEVFLGKWFFVRIVQPAGCFRVWKHLIIISQAFGGGLRTKK